MAKILTFICAIFTFAVSNLLMGQITVTSPTSGGSITQCSNFVISFTSSQYVGSGFAEVYNSSNNIVASYYGLQPSTSNNVTATNLTPGSNYRIKVYDLYNSSNYGWSGYFSVADLQAPSLDSTSSITSSTFTINWNPVSGATNYKLDISTNPNFSSYVSGFQNINTSTLTGGTTSKAIYGAISSNSTYYYRLRTVKGSCASSNSTVGQVLTAPSAPTLNNPSGVTINSFDISWNSVPGSSLYYVELSTNGSFSTLYGGSSFQVSSPSFSISDLSPINTTYYLRIRAKNSQNNYSPYSNTKSICLKGKPNGNLASNVKIDAFTATWSGSNFMNYYLDLATDVNFSTNSLIYNNLSVGTGTSYTFSGLQSGSIYFYRIRGVSFCNGTSASSNTVSASTLGAPILGGISNVLPNSITISWAAVSGANNYLVDVSTNVEFTSGNIVTNAPTSQTSYSINSLNPNTAYYFRVSAKAQSGITTPESNPGSATTAPNAPSVLAPSLIKSDGKFTANWSAVNGAISYEVDVFYCNSSDFARYSSNGYYQNYSVSTTYLAVNPISFSESFTATGPFFYVVRAKNGANVKSPNSNTIAVLPGNYVPNIQGNTNVTSTGFTANWYSVQTSYASATSYVVQLSHDNFVTTDQELNVGLNLSKTFSNLLPNTTYSWRVIANVSFTRSVNGCTYSGTGSSYFAAGPDCVNCRESGISLITTNPKSVKIYPNPVDEYLKIDVLATQESGYPITFEVYDLLGRKLDVTTPEEVEENILRINFSKYESGQYILKVFRSGVAIDSYKFFKN